MPEVPLDREGLAALVEGRSDEDIEQALSAMPVEAVLAGVFTEMGRRLQPERVAGQPAVVQWDVTAPDGPHRYQLCVAEGACSVHEGASEKPRVTLALALPDLVRLAAGTLDGMQAFLAGRLRVSGDLMLAQQVPGWFAPG